MGPTRHTTEFLVQFLGMFTELEAHSANCQSDPEGPLAAVGAPCKKPRPAKTGAASALVLALGPSPLVVPTVLQTAPASRGFALPTPSTESQTEPAP